MGTPQKGKPWLEVGTDKRVAYVFSCPGSVEMEKQRPAAGQTGYFLAIVIALLQGWGAKELPLRDDATVTNAWPEIEHNLLKDGTGTDRTEAEDDEELDKENLKRLEGELLNIEEWILCFGIHANRAVRAVKRRGKLVESVRIAYTDHLSPRHLGKIKQDRFGNTLMVGEPGNRFKQIESMAWKLRQSMIAEE